MSTKIEHATEIAPDQRSRALQEMIAKKGSIPLSDILTRTIVCTPSLAHYGQCSHWIISIMGTPPRGTIIFNTVRPIPRAAFLIVDNECKRLTGKAYTVVAAWVDQFLEATPAVGEFQVELVWNREFDFVSSGQVHTTIEAAIEYAKEMEDSGDGARVKETRIVDSDGKVVWAYGESIT